MRVLVAMSGGVDSSVAAALVAQEGHEVVGVTLKLWSGPGGEAPTAGCCTLSDAEDARRVAAQLDIPYYVFDYTEEFESGVVERFVQDYLHGRTPNPCIECNRSVKFSRLLDQGRDLDCDLLVTGHYARVDHRDGRWRLLRGVDRRKDQSYVLSMLGQEQLARVRFPVGELEKEETRRLAASLGLRTAGKRESQDICFVGRGDYRDFLRGVAPEAHRPGPIVDESGRRLGWHEGVGRVTVGQRRGLGVAVGERRFVVDVHPDSATVVVGPRSSLLVGSLHLTGTSWVEGRPPPAGEYGVQYRAHGEAALATVHCEERTASVTFARPQEAVAPGQTATVYRGDEVVGGGIVARTTRPVAVPSVR